MNLFKSKKYFNQLKGIHDHSLILNPTENIPFQSKISLDFMEGMYIPEEKRDKDSKVIFAGRDSLNQLYDQWCAYLHAADVTFKPHSGLDAHISIFMALGQIGEKVLLLSESAGGHFSTYSILKRLGLEIKEFPINIINYAIDIEKSKRVINDWQPNYIFVDRSEGLYYEDFSWLKNFAGIKIFDASQYLTNIMVNDYMNPFDMGFDIILTSMHKNYPGPQKAAIFFKEKNDIYEKILMGLRIYISNIHPKDVSNILLSLPSDIILKSYSKKMLQATKLLDNNLFNNGLPVVRRDFSKSYTQHIWICPEDKDKTYSFFQNLEKLCILTNYRLLPYKLGYGIRLGTGGAIRQGLDIDIIPRLAGLITEIYNINHIDNEIRKKTQDLINEIRSRNTYE